MIRTRVIPVLLLKGRGLVKTVKFKNPTYLGDPINIVRLFNDKEVDELVFLDITATPESKPPAFDVIADIASQCFMPVCYGGGVRNLDDMERLFRIGVEKVALNTRAVEDPSLVRAAADRFGSQSVIVSIDVQKKLLGGAVVVTHGGRKTTALDPVKHAQEMERRGAGELLVTAVDRDGTMQGYDLDLIRRMSRAVSIPVVACGGAGRLEHLVQAVREGGASAAGAGSFFVFQGPHRAVLISYPTPADLKRSFPS